jgi:WD40-like Beta Propeller Repeat
VRRSRRPALALFAACLAAAAPGRLPAAAAPQEAPPPQPPEATGPAPQEPALAPAPAPQPPPAPRPAGNIKNASLTPEPRLLERGGGRLDWSVQGDSIAFDRRDPDGFYRIYTMRPNGGGEICLTCPHPELRHANAFNPVWHPSGQILVFQVQELPSRLGLSPAGLTSPDRGLHSELWAITRDGRHPWQLTRVGQTGGALLDPCFSHEGDRLAWSERVAMPRGSRWGEWVVRVGRFSLPAGLPRLSKVETFKGPSRGFVAASAFSPDDRHLLESAEVGGGDGLDLFLLDLAGGALTPLTSTPSDWDEGARYSPRGDRLIWTSSHGLPAGPRFAQLDRFPSARAVPRELWTMPAAGGHIVRLTSFNAAAAGGAVVSDFAFSPDGGSLALHVVTDVGTGDEAIYLLDLGPDFRR